MTSQGASQPENAAGTTGIIDLLNQALHIEDSLLNIYPRFAYLAEDKESSELLLRLGTDSMRHAVVVADAIRRMGGEPWWPTPDEESLTSKLSYKEFCTRQLEYEKLARWLYLQASQMAEEKNLKETLKQLAAAEEAHIKVVERLLSKLS